MYISFKSKNLPFDTKAGHFHEFQFSGAKLPLQRFSFFPKQVQFVQDAQEVIAPLSFIIGEWGLAEGFSTVIFNININLL